MGQRSFDNAWYQIKAVLGRRGDRLESLPLVGFGYHVRPQALNGIKWVCHRFGLTGIRALELINQVKNIAEIFLKRRYLIFVDLDPRQQGDLFNVVPGNCHALSPI